MSDYSKFIPKPKVWPNATSKWCTYCKKGDHNDSECWCTRAVHAMPPHVNVSPDVLLGAMASAVAVGKTDWWNNDPTPAYSQPEEPVEQREAKNRVCLDGHLNAALDSIMCEREPDAVFCMLTALAHKAVEIGFAAGVKKGTAEDRAVIAQEVKLLFDTIYPKPEAETP